MLNGDKNIEFRKGVDGRESSIKENDVKIDVDDVDVDDEEEIKKANDFFSSADKSGAQDDENDSEDDSNEDDSDDEDDSDGKLDDDKSDDGDEQDESDEDDSSEEAGDSEDDKEKTGKFGGYDTFEEYDKAMQDRVREAESKSVDGDDTPEKQRNTLINFFKANSNVISQSTIDNFEKFYESGNDAFIHLDTDLTKLYKEMSSFSDKIPFKEKLDKAFKIAFSQKIIKQERKKEKAITEVRGQKINKIASQGTKGNGNKSEKQYSNETQAIAKSWGIKL